MQKKTVIFGQKEAENMKKRYKLDEQMQRDNQKENPVQLKPCPFCGAPAELKEISDRWTAKCTKECAGTKIFNDKERAIETWNRRNES